MRAEDPSVDMEFIDYHKFQVLEEGYPFRMMRKDSGMKHIRVRDHNIPLVPNRFPGIRRGISIIGERGYRFFNPSDQALELKHLVLGKGLRWEEIEGL